MLKSWSNCTELKTTVQLMDAMQETIGWETYLTAGTKALGLSRYDDAEKLFQKALMEARKELQDGARPAEGVAASAADTETTDSLNAVPSAAVSSSAAANSLVGDNAQLAEIGVARISAKMGELYLVQGKFKESESFLKQAIDLFERTHGKVDRLPSSFPKEARDGQV